jgi:hypothetical protein
MATQVLLDDWLPRYDFWERHAVRIEAPIDACRRAVKEWRADDSLLWRLLPLARGLGKPAGTVREWAESAGFICLADSGDEVVYGIAGRFWALDERGALARPRSPEEFAHFDKPGNAVAAMNVRLARLKSGATGLSTETRIRAVDDEARRRFRLYWLLIRPFSGLLRQSMLQGMKARALREPIVQTKKEETRV